MRVERWDVRRDGPLSEAALQRKLAAHGYQVSDRTYAQGAVVGGQAAPAESIEAVLTGLVRVSIDGENAILTAGDLVFVPRGAVRRLEVVGSSPARCLGGSER